MSFFRELLSDPLYAKAIEEAEARYARCIRVRCAWGTCVDHYDPVERTIIGGFGRPMCGCENLPGWNARHPAGKPKPGWSGKVRGRHGSRIQRSKARRAAWLSNLDRRGT